jgi:RHS repeat-associated protein
MTATDTVQNSPGNTHLYLTWNWGITNNNGNLQSSSASHGGPNYPQFLTFNDSYLYDTVNRLAAVYDKDVNNSTLWARIFNYDQYGNMSLSVNSGVPLYGTTPVTQNGYNPFNSGNNRLVSARYDAAGNQTQVGSYSLAYDAENRQTQAVDNVSEGQASYGYDGLGQRVTKSNNGLVSTLYVYDIFGQLAAEYNSFAKQQSPCSTCYLSYDHLGSLRLVTDNSTKANIIARHDYLPFGEEIPANTAGRLAEWGPFGDKVNQKFTGQERDDETGFDFFQARYFYGAQGRFNSPDPGNAGADITNPQTWNGYAYTRNNPLSLIDPTGTCSIKEGDTAATDDPGEPCVAPGDTSTTVNGGPPDAVPPDNSAPEYPIFFDQTPTFFDTAYGQPIQSQQPLGQQRQTFSGCMAAHANDASIVGGVDRVFGTSFRDTFLGGVLGGNSIAGLLYGSAQDSSGAAVGNTPEIVTRAMGTATTYGRRTSTIMALNIAGKGGLPVALGRSTTAVKGALGATGEVLSLGLSFETRLGIDVALTSAEAVYCASQP